MSCYSGWWPSSHENCGINAEQRQSATQEPSTTRTCQCYFWSWRWKKKATSTCTPTVVEEAALGAKAERIKDTDHDRGLPPENARIMSNVQDLFWCDARDEQGCLLHAPDCDQRECFVVQGKKQETNTGGKAKLPDYYRCTITCAFCGKRKHYEDECYQNQRLSAKLKTKNGSGKGNGKGNADKNNGQGASNGNGKGQGGKGKGGQGGCDRKPDKDKNVNQSGGNPNTTPGGHSVRKSAFSML